jgi:hypothetical protein
MAQLRVRFELDIPVPADADGLRELVLSWLDEGSQALASDSRRLIEEGPELPVRAFKANIPCGPPGAAWGLLSLSRRTAKGAPINAVIPTAASLRRFGGRIDDAMIFARIALYTLDDRGYPGERHLDMYVDRDEEARDFLALTFSVPEDDLRDAAFQRTCAGLLRRFAEMSDPAYGETGYDDGLPSVNTVIESLVGPPWRSYSDTIKTARQTLRGYGWITVIPAELAPAVGGAEGLRALNRFAEVAQLPAGGVWVQATADYNDYSVESAESVVRALAPILPPGRPDLAYGRKGVPYKVALIDPSEISD